MSGQFLANILKIENSVKSNSSQPCCICLQDFGTLSAETGVIECGVRLPCSHFVGSSCIATWLRANNTCPLCRRVFFPAQPRPYLEHGIVTETPRRSENERSLEVWHESCNELNLSSRANAIAFQMAQRLGTLGWMGGHNGFCVGTAAMYIVSHIMGEPKSPEHISSVVNVEPHHIRGVYRCIYPNRDRLVFRELLAEPAARANLQGVFRLSHNGACLEDMLALLPTPAHGNGSIEGDTEAFAVSELEYHLISHREDLEQLVDRFCTELGYDQGLVGGFIELFCQDIAHSIRNSMFLAGRSPQPIIAVSIYMSSHLLGVGTSIKRISEVVGVSERTIRTAYKSIYPRRNELVKLDFYRRAPHIKLRQALAWPALT